MVMLLQKHIHSTDTDCICDLLASKFATLLKSSHYYPEYSLASFHRHLGHRNFQVDVPLSLRHTTTAPTPLLLLYLLGAIIIVAQP